MRRREFIKLSTGGMASLAFPLPLLAQKTKRGAHLNPGKERTLITLFLRGGADPLSAIPPIFEKAYYEMRPSLAIPRPGDKTSSTAPDVDDSTRPAIPIDGTFGFHPSLSPLMPLFRAKQMAGIINVGSPHPTRSHFDAQDFMDYAAPGLRSERNGWLNRFLTLTSNPNLERKDRLRAIAMQPLLPRALRGDYAVLACPPNRIRSADESLDLFDDLYDSGMEDSLTPPTLEDVESIGDQVAIAGRETIEKMRLMKRILGTRLITRPTIEYPKGGLGASLNGIAQLMWAGSGLEVASLDIPSWDHHTEQGPNDGAFAQSLGIVARNLEAFARDITPFWDRTLVLIMSEFGRTCRENGNFGSDHGHGGFMLALGGSIRGGKILGKWSRLRDEFLYEGRDLPVTTDFRDVFAEVLRGHMGFDIPKNFFPDYRVGDGVGLI